MNKTIYTRILKSDMKAKMPVIIHPRVVRKNKTDSTVSRKTKPTTVRKGCGCGKRVSRR